jgi:hypothetical protein
MINNPTVFVVGAGASAELGFPLGRQLATEIGRDLSFRFEADQLTDGDSRLYSYLKEISRNGFQTLLASSGRLQSILGTFPSIDEALHYLSSDLAAIEIGKMCIANRIINAESEAFKRSSLESMNDSWLSNFFSLALSGHTRETAANAFAYTTIVCFNYDRVIEQYLFLALQSRAGLSDKQAAEAIKNLTILRPYGGLGPLPFHGKPEDAIHFGSAAFHLTSMAANIRTFTEPVEPSHGHDAVKSALKRASTVVILGYGYHQQNNRILRIGHEYQGSNQKRCFATVYGVDNHNHGTIEDDLRKAFGMYAHGPTLVDMKSSEMLAKLRPTLSSLMSA